MAPSALETRYILFRYKKPDGTEVLVGTALAWMLAVIILAIYRPEVFAFPAGLTALWKYWRGT